MPSNNSKHYKKSKRSSSKRNHQEQDTIHSRDTPATTGHGTRKKKKKQQRSSTSVMMDIEQELQKQRRKRALQEEQQQQQPSPPPPSPKKKLGNYRYDPEKQAYFPKSAVNTTLKSETKKSHDVSPCSSIWQTSPILRSFVPNHNRIPGVLYAAETCFKNSLSRRMRSWCAMRQTLYSTNMVPTTTIQHNNNNNHWISMLSPYCQTPFTMTNNNNNGSTAAEEFWDLTCKSYTMPWASTFDVSPGTERDKLPAFLTLVDGGCMLRLQSEPKLWDCTNHNNAPPTVPQEYFLSNGNCSFFPAALTMEDPLDFDAIQFQVRNDKLFDNSNYLFGTISRSDHPNKGMFHLFATQEPRCLTTLSCSVNDFSLSIAGTIDDCALAFAPQKCSNAVRLAPVFYNFGSQSCVSYPCKDFPQSDVLCVEHVMCDSNLILYGHRNGQASLLDSRTRKIVSVLGNDKDDRRDFGSVAKLLTVPDSPTLLVKGSFGSCRVHDLRRLGDGDSSLRNVLKPPVHSWNKTLSSSYCSGIAMHQGICIFPYCNDDDREPRLGLWCLDTGAFIGSKRVVVGASSSSSSASIVPYCELASTVTRAYEMTDNNDTVNVCQRSFGLWLKCGQVEPNAPAKAGSIHHVTMPGDARQAVC